MEKENKIIKLGKLEQVPLREVWPHEAHNFTKWLAQEENLAALSEELNINLSLIKTEEQVGSFFIDILCETEEEDSHKVIIENQLEKTNHDHLGKMITYASAVDAKYLIWVVSDVREEHQSAVEWLNKIAGDKVSFFLIKMELWSINNSDPAPKFNIIVQPNNWSKIASTQSSLPGDEPMKKRHEIRLAFWTMLDSAIEKYGKYFKPGKMIPLDHWYNFYLGKRGIQITVDLLQRESKIRINYYLYGEEKNNNFDKLFQNKEEIESKLPGINLIWENDLEKKHSKIYHMFDFELENRNTWPEVNKNIVEKVEMFKEAFSKYLK
jgi:hypothetical protein